MSEGAKFVLTFLGVIGGIGGFVGILAIVGKGIDLYNGVKRENRLYQCNNCKTYRREYQLDMSTATSYRKDDPRCVYKCVKVPKKESYGLDKYIEDIMGSIEDELEGRKRDTDRKETEQKYEYHRGYMSLVKEEYKWMRYVEDFPKLSVRDFYHCLRIKKKLSKRRRELRAYRTWVDNWMKHNDGPLPVSEEQVIKSIGGKEYVDLLTSDHPISINSIRKDLNLPRLGK